MQKTGQVKSFDVQGKIRQNVLISNQIESHNPSENYKGSYVVYLTQKTLLSQRISMASSIHKDVKQTSNSNNLYT
ncbi:unnamed protein product [Paramecium primaurelia]|uniref:Uncharacterized protein n=1 Tax=Paramecium primaurelia TaxID=5886 RepID=A0A8S1KBC6_PARPR|nr:unnamed protein product [Paramecium primaurelia]